MRKDQQCGPHYAQNPLTLIMKIKAEPVEPPLSNATRIKEALVKFGLDGGSGLSVTRGGAYCFLPGLSTFTALAQGIPG